MNTDSYPEGSPERGESPSVEQEGTLLRWAEKRPFFRTIIECPLTSFAGPASWSQVDRRVEEAGVKPTSAVWALFDVDASVVPHGKDFTSRR